MGASHLRVAATEPDRSCQGHSVVQHPRLAVHPPGRQHFRPSQRRRFPGPGGGSARGGAPSRAARRRLGPQVLGILLEQASGTARPGRGGLELFRRWARSPGNGAGYGAPQRPNRAASLSAGIEARGGAHQGPLEPQPTPLPIPFQLLSSTTHSPSAPLHSYLLEILTCPKRDPLQFLRRPPLSGRTPVSLHTLRVCAGHWTFHGEHS